MKALYLIFHGFGLYNGISKKIHYQVYALKQCGVDARLCYIEIDKKGVQRRMIDGEILEEFEVGIRGKIKKWINYSAILSYIKDNGIDLLYVRSYHNANPFLISAVKKLNKEGVKTVMEIPTYPYDNEYKKHRLKLRADQCFRHSLAKQLFKIVTFSNDSNIFGAETINISNGIDFDAIKIRKPIEENPNILNLISVAEIHIWHGFDRLLKGLAEYYKTAQRVEVRYDIVGYGDEQEIAKLKKYVVDNNLGKYVTFHGPQYGDVLDNIFDKTSVGIASLARHRSGITNIKTLKNREYAARGIPFVYSEIDDDFEDKPYIMKVSADETPINISDVVLFYNKVKTLSPEEIRDSISNLSWKNQMEKVILVCQ